RTKVACEQVVAESGLPWTTLRATQFHYLVAGMFRAQRRLPVLVLPRGVRFQPVSVRDVAIRLVDLARGEPAGRVDDLGGPEVQPVDELAQTYLHALGLARRVVALPVPGRVGRQLRHGSNLTPEHANGTITFGQYLREQPWGDRHGVAGAA
ncbi:MAG TPA: NAD-dependent epimerase/dehydratase family protein, partial [Segeticoccus sp.]|uniref:SDR family oxidoreductase n=1 Tax=Segeticoccus sp. TaxID=2706531 RepID=UPI002D8BA1BE|nr:NAD-dependent epimerase/dehydratase family protein [Segeticoccus sp.]